MERRAEQRKPRIAKVIGVKAPVTRGGNRGGDRRVHRRDKQKQNKDEAARVGVRGLADEPDNHRPCESLERLGEDECPAPAAGVERGVVRGKQFAGKMAGQNKCRDIEGEPK